MSRSPGDEERRRAYTKAWFAAHPNYRKEWREKHKESEKIRRRKWKQANRDKVRAQHARRRERLRISTEPLPEPYTGHVVFDSARAILNQIGLREHGGMKVWSDPTWHDTMGEMVLAYYEGRNMEEAARRSWSTERRWKMIHIQLLWEGD